MSDTTENVPLQQPISEADPAAHEANFVPEDDIFVLRDPGSKYIGQVVLHHEIQWIVSRAAHDRRRAAFWAAHVRGLSIENGELAEETLTIVTKARDRGRRPEHTRQILVYTQPEWEAFIGGVKDGEFDN